MQSSPHIASEDMAHSLAPATHPDAERVYQYVTVAVMLLLLSSLWVF